MPIKQLSLMAVFCGLTMLVIGVAVAADTSSGLAGFQEPGNTPQVFAPGLISTEAYEFAVTFTPDMSEMYLTRRADPEPNKIIMARVLEKGLEFAVPPPFRGAGDQFEPCVAPDGMGIYFGEADRLVVSRRDGGSWSTPEVLPNAVNSGFAMAICVDARGDLYFTGRDGLMVARRDGNGYRAAESLGPYFTRAEGGSAHGYIAPDGSYLVFDSQGRSDTKGRSDLYVSFHTAGNGWTEPKNLDVLNTVGTDMCASVSPDGRFLFFSRDGDIWWIDAAVLQIYR